MCYLRAYKGQEDVNFVTALLEVWIMREYFLFTIILEFLQITKIYSF
jgi:hypothetical protein